MARVTFKQLLQAVEARFQQLHHIPMNSDGFAGIFREIIREKYNANQKMIRFASSAPEEIRRQKRETPI